MTSGADISVLPLLLILVTSLHVGGKCPGQELVRDQMGV